MTIRVAVVGVGRWGQHFARLLFQHSDCELVALVDYHKEQLQAVSERLQLPPSIRHFSNFPALIAQSACDAVIITTPATSHFALIQAAIAQGLHILAEKPLTLDAAECEQLTQLAQAQQVQLFVDHTYRFNPAIEVGANQISQLGTLRYGYATRSHIGPVRSDVDVLWDLAIHDLSIFNHWLGENPVQVRAWGQWWLQEKHHDVMWATLQYPSGFVANCHWCWDNPDKQRRLGIVGDRGTLVFDEMNPAATLQLCWGESQRQKRGYVPHNVQREVIAVPEQETLQRVCDRFLDSIHTGQVPEAASGETATRLVAILQALARSLVQEGSWQRVKGEG